MQSQGIEPQHRPYSGMSVVLYCILNQDRFLRMRPLHQDCLYNRIVLSIRTINNLSDLFVFAEPILKMAGHFLIAVKILTESIFFVP